MNNPDCEKCSCFGCRGALKGKEFGDFECYKIQKCTCLSEHVLCRKGKTPTLSEILCPHEKVNFT